MKVAYADPPYPGQAERHYGDHPDYAGEVDHAELIARLDSDYDAWALSTSARALPDVLALTGPLVRMLVWVKPTAPPFPGLGKFSWEPVLIRNQRRVPNDLRDYLICSPEMFTFRPRPADHVTGAKPPMFCRWLFQWLSLTPDDDFADLFPGSGAVAREWSRFIAQPTLDVVA